KKLQFSDTSSLMMAGGNAVCGSSAIASIAPSIHAKEEEKGQINQRKEFFKVSLDEIEKVVLENYNGTVSFTKLAQAEQYRRSL
ncbi:putative sulfate exporter family transporter, partial [Enterococcus faecium]|uniref:putative sulfate exporter family transporter n=1 Tax=Enterococcus faecium TaxID=1352 RepID=UPI0029302291